MIKKASNYRKYFAISKEALLSKEKDPEK